MSTPPPHLDLTDEQMRLIEAFAKQNQMEPQEAASMLASLALRDMYVKPRTNGAVLPFKRG